MELRKVTVESILENAHNALKKVNSSDYAAVENICACIVKLKYRCEDRGYRAIIGRDELFDFIDDINRRVKSREYVIVVTVSRNTSVDKLKELRRLCDNAVDSIVNLNESLNGAVTIEAARIKQGFEKEYAIDFAATLL